MKWRERWNVDNILDWKTPQPLTDYSPHGISGFDKEGSPSKPILFTECFIFTQYQNLRTNFAFSFSLILLTFFLYFFFTRIVSVRRLSLFPNKSNPQ